MVSATEKENSVLCLVFIEGHFLAGACVSWMVMKQGL